MERRAFLTSVGSAAACFVSHASVGLFQQRPGQRAFGWGDAENRTRVSQLAISSDGQKAALQVTRPLSSCGLFAESGWARPNFDLRGALWLLNDSLGSPQELSIGGRGVWSPCFSPDGSRLAALTLSSPGRVALVVWELATGQFRVFDEHNIDIYSTVFRSAVSAYESVAAYSIPHRYLWLDTKSILFVDHGPTPQQYFLAQTGLTETLKEYREVTLAGGRSVRVWSNRSATCGAGASLARLRCDTGAVNKLYSGDIRGVSVSPDMRSAVLVVATESLTPLPNTPVDAPLGMIDLGEPMVKLKVTLLDMGGGGTADDIQGVTGVGAVPPERLPVWSEDSTRFSVPVRATYSDRPSTGDDAAWEVVTATRESRKFPASSALDAQLLAVMVTTEGLNEKSVLERRPRRVDAEDYERWWQIKGGAWRCSATQILLWNAPALSLIGTTSTTTVPGRFGMVLPPTSNYGEGRTLALRADGTSLIISSSADRYRVEELRTAPGWTLLGLRPRDATVVYTDNSSTGTFLRLANPYKRPRTAGLSFNTYFREVLRPRRIMLTRSFPDGTVRKGVLQLPIGHKPGERHSVVVYAYPNFAPALDGPITRTNSEYNVIYPVQYLLANGFAFFHAPFPISGRKSKEPMHAAVEAILPWLDVLDRQADIIPGEYGCWGHSNAGYVALALEALTQRFKAIVAWGTFPELGFSDLHSNALTVALDCAGNIVQSWRAVVEDAGNPFTPQPTLSWANPGKYIRNDPVFNLSRASTPLLLVEGEFDDSPKEMEEVYSILRAKGVPVELAYYWGEGHNFASPGNIRDSWLRTERFFKRYLAHNPR